MAEMQVPVGRGRKAQDRRQDRTPSNAFTDKLVTEDALALHLDALEALDPRLAAVRAKAGVVGLRITEPGFAGMARVICGQQLSVASARAIWGRFEAIPGALAAQTYLGLEESAVRASGFSGGKFRTLRVVAEAVAEGRLDFSRIDTLPAEEAIAELVTLKGIGPWTAEIYLLFCAGHPDVFPAGDLALQKAVGHALGLADKPASRDLAAIAGGWSPHRGAAALMFWRYFAALKERDGIAL